MTIPNLYNRFPSTELVEFISSTVDVADARLGSTVPEFVGGKGGPGPVRSMEGGGSMGI